MKKIEIKITSCRMCPYFKKFGMRSTPGCKNGNEYEAFGAKELPHTFEIDAYNRNQVAVFSGGIPSWCPLDDA